MANIHRLNQNRNQNNNNGDYRALGQSNIIQQISQHKIPFLYMPPNNTPPLDQSIPFTLKLTFCPALKIISFTNILVLVLITLYIACCIQGIQNIQASGQVLSIQPNVLKKMGANIPYYVKIGGVYRLITAAFLHANIAHLLSNCVSAYILISRLEACFNVAYIISIYFISAISGNILSDLCTNNPIQISVGASTALYGYIAALVAYLIINWQTLAGLGPLRAQLTCIIGMITFMAFLFSFFTGSNQIDYFGHIGGFIGGMFGSLLILPAIDEGGPKTSKIVGGVILGVYILVTFLVFYLAKFK